MIDRFMAHRLDPGIKRYLKKHFPDEAYRKEGTEAGSSCHGSVHGHGRHDVIG